MQLQSFLQQYAAHPSYKAPRGNSLNAKSWQTEAPLANAMLNNSRC
jgi:urocanate hydratase